MKPLFIFPTGLAFHLFVIKRICAKLSRVFFNGTKHFTTEKNSRNVGLYTEFPKTLKRYIPRLNFAVGIYLKEIRHCVKERESKIKTDRKNDKNNVNYARNICCRCAAYFSKHSIYASFRNRNLYTPYVSDITNQISFNIVYPFDRAIVSHFHLSVCFICDMFDDQYCTLHTGGTNSYMFNIH